MSVLTSHKSTKKVSTVGSTLDVTINNDCTFINNSTQDVLVLKAYSDADTIPPLEIFEETLTILSTKEGKQIIKAGTSGIITLSDTHKDDDGNDVDTTSYEFIIARADNLFPVKSASAVRQTSSDRTQKFYNSITIVKTVDPTDSTKELDDYVNMRKAETFHQNIMAYPSYPLAQNFQTALDHASTASKTDTEDYIVDFFANTDDYTNVNLNMLSAITTYYTQFPYIWTDYTPTKTYYLYSAGADVKYAGSLVITVPTVVPASTSKTLSGFTFVFTGVDANKNDETPINLLFHKDQFVDVVSDTPGICLIGGFKRQGDLTNDNTQNRVISIIAGRIGGLDIIGFDQKQTETTVTDGNGDTSKKWSGMYDLLHADNLGKVVALVMTAGGLGMIFKEIYGAIKKRIDKSRAKKAEKENAWDDSPLTQKDLDALKKQIDDYTAARNADNQASAQRLDPSSNGITPDQMKAAMEQYSKDLTEQVTSSLKEHLYDTLDAQNALLEKILEYTSSPRTDKASDDIEKLGDQLDNAITTEQMGAIATDATTKVSSINAELATDYSSSFKKAAGTEKTELQEAKTQSDAREVDSKNLDEQRQDRENEKEPIDDEFPDYWAAD